MSPDELDAHTSEALGRARRALSPTPEDAARVLAATLRVAATGAGAGKVAPWKLPLMAAAGAALLALPGGYTLGYRAGAEAGRRQAPALLQPSAAVVAGSTEPRTRAGSLPDALAPSDGSHAAAPAEPVRAAPIAAPVARARVLTAPAPAARAAAADDAPPLNTASTPSSADDLRRELDAIRRVELALREGHPRMALSILDRLDREIPQGKLHEERLASFVMARCAIGLGSHAALVREFSESYPESVYGERVTRSCNEP